jgi:8-oxo-dGTP diphosphatase
MKHVAVGILLRDGRVLACQRKNIVRYPLKWEFPGGKIEKGESAHQALVRELKEELNIDARPDALLLTHDWTYPEDNPHHESDGAFRVSYFIVRQFTGQPVNRTFEEIRWVTPEELQTMDVLAGNHEAIALLLQRKRGDGSPL